MTVCDICTVTPLVNSDGRTDLVQIDLDDLVVLAAFVWHQQVTVFISKSRNLCRDKTVSVVFRIIASTLIYDKQI